MFATKASANTNESIRDTVDAKRDRIGANVHQIHAHLHSQSPLNNPGMQAEALGQPEEEGAGVVPLRRSSNAFCRIFSVHSCTILLPSLLFAAICAMDSANCHLLKTYVSRSHGRKR
eukprot:1325476-Prymnesium_polylepis.2